MAKFLDMNGVSALWAKVKALIPTDNNELANGAGYQTADEVETAITGKGYQTASDVETAITGKGYQTEAQVGDAITEAVKDFATDAEVETAITGKGYQTASDVETAITGKGYQTEAQVGDAITEAVKDFATDAEVEAAITGKGYQTQTQVSDAITEATTGLATETYVNNKVSNVYRLKGSCAVAELPTEGQEVGDTYNLTDESTYGPAGTNVAWTSENTWDALAGIMDTSAFLTGDDVVALTTDELDEMLV